MKILVLGGTGYVGSKLIEKITDGNDVYCAVRQTSNTERIRAFGAKIITADSLEGLTGSIDVFVNLSCKYANYSTCNSEIIESNLCAPLKVLSRCLNLGVKKVITIGTGLPDDFNEYSFTKKMFSEYGYWLTKKHSELAFYDVKLESYYGPDEPLDRFIPSVIDKLKRNEPIKLTEGTQKRDFIHIDDVICGLQNMIFHTDINGYHDIPLGTGDDPTIRELVDYLKVACDSSSNLMYGAIPMRIGEPDSVADIEKMKKYGFEPIINWKEGFRAMCKVKK